jgi:uncharacterized protein (UPF0332 family)
MTTLDDCFRKGDLRKTQPSIAKASASLKLAKDNASDAAVHINNKMCKWAMIAAYTSMFHSARALLFKDGVKERSHFCMAIYVKEKYTGAIESKYLNELNVLREQRHMIFYGDENLNVLDAEEEEADSAVKLAMGFLESVKKIIEK